MISREIIIQYFLCRYSTVNFEENLSDDRNRIYSLDSFIYKEFGANVKICKDMIPSEGVMNEKDINIEFDNFQNMSCVNAISETISSPVKTNYNNNNDNKNCVKNIIVIKKEKIE